MREPYREMWRVADNAGEVLTLLEDFPDWNPMFDKNTQKES